MKEGDRRNEDANLKRKLYFLSCVVTILCRTLFEPISLYQTKLKCIYDANNMCNVIVDCAVFCVEPKKAKATKAS